MSARLLGISVMATLALLVAPGAAQASACPVGNSGITRDRSGRAAKFKRLTTYAGMNCASARYVLNRWIRRSYARRGKLLFVFDDGYVTWHCSKLTDVRWECKEYESDTRFRFTAIRL